MYLFLGVPISISSSFVWFLSCNPFADYFFETLVISSAVLLPIKSPVASAVASLGSIEYLIFICFKATSACYTRNLHLITIVKFILSSISNGWLLWSVNHTIISSYSALNVFKNICFIWGISNKLPNSLFWISVYNNTLESCW